LKKLSKTLVILVAVTALVAAACSGSSSGGTDTTTTTTVTVAPTATVAPTSTSTTTTSTTTTTTAPTAPPLDTSGDQVVVVWSSLPSSPHFSFVGGGDPHYLIHTNPGPDGFFLSFEMYTTGYGAEWTGELGTFDISCDHPNTSTGICPYFDPDGPGPIDVLGTDFATTGSLTINALGGDGYDIVIHELIFSDGTSFSEFQIVG